jgi:putative transposase
MCYAVIVKMRYRFRCYPTLEQQIVLARTFGACRYVYNWALRLRTDSYRNGVRVNYHASSAALTALKRQADHAWLNDISCVPLQQSLRHLQTAFQGFFDKRSAYPAFKKKHGRQSAEYTRSAFKWAAEHQHLTLSKIGRLRVRWSRSFASDPTTVTITKDRAGRYFVTLVLDEAKAPLPATGAAVGVDLGVNRLVTLSNGEQVQSRRVYGRYRRKLGRLQHKLARQVKGSARREQTRRAIAKLQAKIADTRLDQLHKVTTDLVRRFDLICVEDLNVRGMVRNHRLARSLSDAALGQFLRLLEYKCRWSGKELVKVDRFFPSSKTCHACGSILAALPLSVRAWACPACGAVHDRDENAAKNILAVGHTERQNARGGHVRPKRVSSRTGSARRTANPPVSKCAPHAISGDPPA